MAYTSAQLITAYTAANNGVAPTPEVIATLGAMAAQNQAGQLSDSAALAYIIDSAQDDVEVAIQAYQFFTGKTPSKAGLDFLTNSATNTTDLNDPYYTQFNLENRYINFAANLGLNGEGAANFAAVYGGMTFTTFVGVVYETIIGSAYAQAAKINVATAVADIISRQAAFVQTARDRSLINATSTAAQIDIATKAAVVGYLMAEGVKADVGIYAAGANNLVNALIAGTAQHNVNLLTTYSTLGSGLPSPANPGQGGQLTVNPETITSNIFNAPQAYTPGGNDLINTLQNDDKLVGVGANPTLNVTLGNPNNNGAATITPQLLGIESVNARFDATSTSMVLDLQDSGPTALNSGVKTINVTRVAANTTATVQNIAESIAANLSVSNSNAPSNAVNFTYLTSALAQPNNAGAVTLSNVDIATLRIEENNAVPTEGFETLTVNSVGSTNKVGVLRAEDVQTLNIAGDKNLTLGAASQVAGTTGFNLVPAPFGQEATRYGAGLANMAGSLSKVDASAYKGNLDLTLGAEFNAGKDDTSGVNIQLSVIGGDGNDTFRLVDAIVGGAANNTDSLNGGGGTNTVVVLGNTTIAAAGTLAAPIANITNIQALQIRAGQDTGTVADTVNINADAFDKLAAIFIRNEGQQLVGATWTSANEVMTVNLSNLTSAQLNGLTLAHGTTGNSGIGNNAINASLKVATGNVDTATLTLVDRINNDPIFNFAFTTLGTERVTIVDNDSESNGVFLDQGGFAAAAAATVAAQAGSSITLTGGVAGKYFSLDTFGSAASVTMAGFNTITNGSTNDVAASLASTAIAGVPASFSTSRRDPTVSFFVGSGTTTFAADNLATRYVMESLNAGAYLGDVIIRLGEVTRADGVSSQSLVTGSGNDSFIFDATGLASAGFTSGDTISAGTGTDTLAIDGNNATRISIATSEWDNLKGIDVLRLAGNLATFGGGVANVGTSNWVASTGGGYYVAIDNDFIAQTDSGNRLTIINNDGVLDYNTQSDAVIDLRGLSQNKWVTFIGENSVGGVADGSTTLSSNRIILDDVSANSNMVLSGGDTDVRVQTTAGYALANNNALEIRNTANISLSDLSQMKDFNLIEFTNDQTIAQTLTLALSNTVVEALVDSSATATTLATEERLNIAGTDGAAAAILNVDARTVSGFHGLSIQGSASGNDVLSLATNVGGSVHNVDLRGGTGDRINWSGTTDSSIFTFGATGAAAFTSGGVTTSHFVRNVEIIDVSQQTDGNSQFRFSEGDGVLAAANTFPPKNIVFGFDAATDTVRVSGVGTSVILNGVAAAQAAGTPFTQVGFGAFNAAGAIGGAFLTSTINPVTSETLARAAINTIANETVGEEAYFAIRNTIGDQVGIYHWVSAVADNAATAGELELLGVINYMGTLTAANFVFF